MRSPRQPADYLNIVSRAVFSAGLSWALVDEKWDAFEEAFHGFDPVRVAALGEEEIDRIAEDPRLVRSRKKVVATVENAKALLALDREPGGIRGWLDHFESYAAAAHEVSKRFRYLGKTFGAYYFLYIAGARIPDFPSFEEWTKLTGEGHPRMAELVATNEGRPVAKPSRSRR